MIRPLALQRTAAELVDRIPALRTVIGIDDATGLRRGHIGSVCDLLLEAGIDTDRWTGVDIAQALNRDGSARGWTWPTVESMTAPLRLVAFRLSQLDWTGSSLTERKLHGRELADETAADAAHRLRQAHRRALAATSATQAPPASDEHRRTVRAQMKVDLDAKKALAAGHAR